MEHHQAHKETPAQSGLWCPLAHSLGDISRILCCQQRTLESDPDRHSRQVELGRGYLCKKKKMEKKSSHHNFLYIMQNMFVVKVKTATKKSMKTLPFYNFCINKSTKWAASSEFGIYRLCEQRWFRQACASAQPRQNLGKRYLQTESQIPDPSEWLRMRS